MRLKNIFCFVISFTPVSLLAEGSVEFVYDGLRKGEGLTNLVELGKNPDNTVSKIIFYEVEDWSEFEIDLSKYKNLKTLSYVDCFDVPAKHFKKLVSLEELKLEDSSLDDQLDVKSLVVGDNKIVTLEKLIIEDSSGDFDVDEAERIKAYWQNIADLVEGISVVFNRKNLERKVVKPIRIIELEPKISFEYIAAGVEKESTDEGGLRRLGDDPNNVVLSIRFDNYDLSDFTIDFNKYERLGLLIFVRCKGLKSEFLTGLKAVKQLVIARTKMDSSFDLKKIVSGPASLDSLEELRIRFSSIGDDSVTVDMVKDKIGGLMPKVTILVDTTIVDRTDLRKKARSEAEALAEKQAQVLATQPAQVAKPEPIPEPFKKKPVQVEPPGGLLGLINLLGRFVGFDRAFEWVASWWRAKKATSAKPAEVEAPAN